MKTFYRFRSIDNLLGEKYNELENQSIYFASPNQLNDPMEGFKDLVFNGDVKRSAKLGSIKIKKSYI